MSNGSSPLQLKYVFTPDPSPIYQSADGANPNTVDLGVIVSNATEETVALEKIQIEIPVGADVSGDLSSATTLPSPVYDTSTFSNLDITSSGSVVTIQTKDGTNLTVSVIQPLTFTLSGIQVGTVYGTVQLTVTEFPPSGPKVMDTYSLQKQQVTMPVTNFWADPPTLDDLDQAVTLHWSCNDLGKNYSYGLGAPDWQPRDCANTGNCFSVQDGLNGVQSPGLSRTTEFTLTVYQASDGSRKSVGTLTTKVQVLVPLIVPDSSQAICFSGTYARLNWLATNASKCMVYLDGGVTPIDDDAPVNTYLTGYYLRIPSPGQHSLSVTALGRSDSRAQAQHTFPPFNAAGSGPRVVATGKTHSAVAITPDGTLALAACADDDSVTVIDIATLTPRPQAIPVGGGPIAITPDGTLALCISPNRTVTVIEIATLTPGSQVIPVCPGGDEFQGPAAIAITPDGTLALVACAEYSVTVIDIATLTAEPQPILLSRSGGLGIQSMAITPDGKLAICQQQSLDVDGYKPAIVIDIAARNQSGTIAAGYTPLDVAITPDGTLALFADYAADNVIFTDIATGTTEAISVGEGQGPRAIAITPDGSLAIVAINSDDNLILIDIAKRTVLGTIPKQGSFSLAPSVAVTPDGTKVFVTLGQPGVCVT